METYFIIGIAVLHKSITCLSIILTFQLGCVPQGGVAYPGTTEEKVFEFSVSSYPLLPIEHIMAYIITVD